MAAEAEQEALVSGGGLPVVADWSKAEAGSVAADWAKAEAGSAVADWAKAGASSEAEGMETAEGSTTTMAVMAVVMAVVGRVACLSRLPSHQ